MVRQVTPLNNNIAYNILNKSLIGKVHTYLFKPVVYAFDLIFKNPLPNQAHEDLL